MTPPPEPSAAPLVARLRELAEACESAYTRYFETPEEQDDTPLYAAYRSAVDRLHAECTYHAILTLCAALEDKTRECQTTATDYCEAWEEIRRLRKATAQQGEGDRMLAAIREHCRVVYYPTDGSYPIEHAPLANKDAWDELAVALAARRAAPTPERDHA